MKFGNIDVDYGPKVTKFWKWRAEHVRVERGMHCAHLQLYWYNGKYQPTSLIIGTHYPCWRAMLTARQPTQLPCPHYLRTWLTLTDRDDDPWRRILCTDLCKHYARTCCSPVTTLCRLYNVAWRRYVLYWVPSSSFFKSYAISSGTQESG